MSVSKTSSSSRTTSSGWEKSTSQSSESQQSQSSTQQVLNQALLQSIMGGLYAQMTDEEIEAYAQNLLNPVRDAQVLAAEQSRDTANLSYNQQIENLAAQLQEAINQQNSAYQQNISEVERAALQRGMGRSSYTMQTLANQGTRLADTVKQLTDEQQRQVGQIGQQMTLANQQAQDTINEANTSYAQSLASKIQELRNERANTYNSNYLTAISSSMGQSTQGSATAQSSSTGYAENYSDSKTKSSSKTTTSRGGSSTPYDK